jgi:L-2-hydroxyglutarate oxidase LhgO
MDRVDCVVIGAGVVGLACARALALAGREVVVLEAEPLIGSHTSSRNSEVVHAGIYYPQGSLKARLCVAGKELLYRYCADHGVTANRIEKLIVATDDAELAGLKHTQEKARANGVDLAFLTREEALRLEPALRCTGALHSPTTGIVDSHALMLAYQGDAEAHGAMIAFGASVVGGRVSRAEKVLEVGGDEPMSISANIVINSAGPWAPQIAALLHGGEAPTGEAPKGDASASHFAAPAAHWCKGSYFSLTGRAPFSRLIYPTHNKAGLGVHLTLDLGGQARFGPDTEWLTNFDPARDYAVDPARGDGFYAEIRKYWPQLPDGALQPSYAGVRPKIVGPEAAAGDFMIATEADHGIPGLVHLLGIESPGLTASLAIANIVCGAQH